MIIDKIALIYIKNRKLLSSRSIGKDTFYIPGGKREKGETDLETLMREIKEELSAEIIASTVKYYGTFEAQAHGHSDGTVVKMTCYTADLDGVICPSNEIEEFCWFGSEGSAVSSPVDKKIYSDLKIKGLID